MGARRGSKVRVGMIHYSAPPVIGGVERIIRGQAKEFLKNGYPLRIIAGDGEPFISGVEFCRIEEISTSHPENQEINEELRRGEVPVAFSHLKEKVKKKVLEAIADLDTIIIHNMLTMHFNLSATSALREILNECKGKKYILWCHDATYIDPNYLGLGNRENYPWNQLCEKIDGVYYVTITNSRRQLLAKLLGIPPDEIKVVYDAVDPVELLTLHPLTEKIIEKYNLYQKVVFLFPTRILPRKNIELAIEIVYHLNKLGFECSLIITGPPDPHAKEAISYFHGLKEKRAKFRLDKEIIFLYDEEEGGWLVPDEVIPDFFKLSDALLLTSKIEGFGIPIIEGGLFRLPIFANRIPQFKEVGGENINYFDEGSTPAEIAERIIRKYKESNCSQLFKRVIQNFSFSMIFKREIEPMLFR